MNSVKQYSKMKNVVFATIFLNYLILISASRNKRSCNPSATTASGSKAPQNICSGDLIFQDNFDSLDKDKWFHENSLFGFGNHEFEWYTDDGRNSFTYDGKLFIKPSLTSDILGGENKLYSATIDIGPKCTNSADNGCKRTGTAQDVLNPVRSARINTHNSFRFKYGRVEIRAQMPTGDWLWPALWFMPSQDSYGIWPRSGEIDLAESRGNLNYWVNGKNIGVDTVGSTLHWGPDGNHNGWEKTHYEKYQQGNGFNRRFSTYEVMWTPDYIRFSIDGQSIGTADPGSNFWNFGGFAQQGLTDNPWAGRGKMAPFDKEFYIILNLAVGGTNNFFPDEAQNQPYPKPWKNNAPHAMTDFWKQKNQWLPTWKLDEHNGYDASLKVDYVRVWAL